jgi:hypothetical protein
MALSGRWLPYRATKLHGVKVQMTMTWTHKITNFYLYFNFHNYPKNPPENLITAVTFIECNTSVHSSHSRTIWYKEWIPLKHSGHYTVYTSYSTSKELCI